MSVPEVCSHEIVCVEDSVAAVGSLCVTLLSSLCHLLLMCIVYCVVQIKTINK